MRNIIQKILKNRLALSTVITTLIILVVAVLLAGVVTYFAINVVSTRVQQESLQVSNVHVWVDGSGTAEAAMLITNTGGRDVVISQIEVRGQSTDLSSASNYAIFDATVTGDSISNPLAPIATAALITTDPFTPTTATATGSNVLAPPTGTDLVLSSGSTMAVYLTTPDSVTINDIGLTIGLTVFTAQAMYYQETNVQAYSGTL